MIVADSVWSAGRLSAGPSAGPGDRKLSGTLLPALCDAHVHSGLIDLPALKAGGIAAAWDLGSVPAAVRALAGSEDPGLPSLRYAGPFLIAPDGYPSDRAWAAAGSWREVGSAVDAGAAVGEAHAAGATLIKTTAHAGGPLLPAKTLAALIEAAHALELPVVVHAEGPGMVAAAYEAGADLLAHTPWTEELDDGLAAACAGRMTWISTLDIHGRGAPTPQQDTAIGNLRRFLGHGGAVRYGTDLGNGPLPLGVNPREVRALQSAGLSPDEILGAMTDKDHIDRCWVPAGLDLDPGRFAESLATARVVPPA